MHEADWSPKAGTPAMSPRLDPSSPSSPKSPFKGHSLLECDYDLNPTYLYQAIEARQWDHVQKIFTTEDASTQAATWVVRKETTGKLRWRLLPIHASIIFQAPMEIVELLLQEYPLGAQCKDDQGMLPLHLAFRNETEWDVMEELLTAYPHAISVKDRKGRTPTNCASAKNKKLASVLELYSQIAVSSERQRSLVESRSAMDVRIGALQETHMKTLVKLKDERSNQQKDLEVALQATVDELEKCKIELDQAHAQLEEKAEIELALTQKLTQVTQALSTLNEVRKQEDASDVRKLMKRERLLTEANEELLTLVQSLLDQQTSIKVQIDQQSRIASEKEKARTQALEDYSRMQQDTESQLREQRSMWYNLLQEGIAQASATMNNVVTKTNTSIPQEITATQDESIALSIPTGDELVGAPQAHNGIGVFGDPPAFIAMSTLEK